ncbi:MAG: type IV pilin protein [Gammaproteobacteria bacterium]|nr:type IV pilin protein [Gammaproteobacteria bacterium]
MLKSNRTEAQNALLEILAKQQNFFSRNMSYTLDLVNGLNYTYPVVTPGGLYSIAAATCNAPFSNGIANCVELTATAQGRQVPDGDLIINSAGAKTGNW